MRTVTETIQQQVCMGVAMALSMMALVSEAFFHVDKGVNNLSYGAMMDLITEFVV